MKKILLLLIATTSISLMGKPSIHGNKNRQVKPLELAPPAYVASSPPYIAPPAGTLQPPYNPEPSAPTASMFESVAIQNVPVRQPSAANPQEKPTGFKALNPLAKVCWTLAIIPAMAIDTGLCPLMTCGDGCKDTSNSYDEDPEEWDEGLYCLTRRLLRCIDVEEFCCMKTDLRHNARSHYPTGW